MHFLFAPILSQLSVIRRNPSASFVRRTTGDISADTRRARRTWCHTRWAAASSSETNETIARSWRYAWKAPAVPPANHPEPKLVLKDLYDLSQFRLSTHLHDTLPPDL